MKSTRDEEEDEGLDENEVDLSDEEDEEEDEEDEDGEKR